MSDNHENTTLNQDVLASFDAMWGMYPSPVMLIRANREILAVNDVGRKLGITTGAKCFQLTGRDRICNGCLGNRALKENTAQRVAAWQSKLNMFADTYWVPVRGESGIFVHFGNNITEYVKEALCAPNPT